MTARKQRRDHRTFVAIDHNMPDHPKVVGLSDAAFRALVEAICYCSRLETDGNLKASATRKLGPTDAIEELLREGLFDDTGAGYQVHDYLDFQRSAAEIREIRENRRLAGSAGGKAKAAAVADAKQSASKPVGISSGKTGSEMYPETETETYKNPSGSTAQKRGSRLPSEWTPAERDIAWQREQTINDLFARKETEKFIDYWTAASGSTAVKRDWSAAWRNWMRNAVERQNPAPVAAVQQSREVRPAWG